MSWLFHHTKISWTIKPVDMRDTQETIQYIVTRWSIDQETTGHYLAKIYDETSATKHAGLYILSELKSIRKYVSYINYQ